MPFIDMRQFIDVLQSQGDLKVVEGADWDLEIGTITELACQKEAHAMVFDKIKGYPAGYRIAVNLLSTHRRALLASGLPQGLRGLEIVKAWKERLKKYKPVPPRKVSEGPLFENVFKDEQVNLWKLPSPKWNEKDGGRYLGTGCMVITKDPDEGWVNMAPYRVMVHDEKTTGLYIAAAHHGRVMMEKYHARGQDAPVAVAFGQEVATYIASTYPLPWGQSEYEFAGFLRGEPVEVVEGPVTGIPIPATAEIAMEGFVPPQSKETRIEGPFGEWPGYYAHGAMPEPVVHVKALYHRDDPIIFGAPPRRPPYPFDLAGRGAIRAAQVWEEMERAGVTGVKGVYKLESGGIHFITAVSVKQLHQGHANWVASAAASVKTGAPLTRIVIVVDEDIDPSNIYDVMWAVATRCDPEEAVQIVKGVWSNELDPMISPEKKAKHDYTTSRIIINACRPYRWMNDFPPVVDASPEIKKKTLEKWASLFEGVPKQA
ncbi:MAG: UbiD family decarboxylase [Thaumarchaeota archaeon]|nr:UbiD family decarboxylase [Nitrososphaerota archaeon]